MTPRRNIIKLKNFRKNHEQRILALEQNSGDVYSLNEVAIGKWINGETVFRQVILGNLVNGNFVVQMPFIKEVINLKGVYNNSNSLPFANITVNAQNSIVTSLQGDLNYNSFTQNINVNIFQGVNAVNGKVTIIIEYIKK